MTREIAAYEWAKGLLGKPSGTSATSGSDLIDMEEDMVNSPLDVRTPVEKDRDAITHQIKGFEEEKKKQENIIKVAEREIVMLNTRIAAREAALDVIANRSITDALRS